MNFNIQDYKSMKYITFPSLKKYKTISHCFTTRIGGTSLSPYKSLNLGVFTEDDQNNIHENFKKACNCINTDLNTLVIPHQIHNTNIKIIDKKINHDPIKNIIPDTDALITNIKNVTLFTLYADCTPLFIFDTQNTVIALSHAGWRGTVNKIGKKTIEKMKEHFGTNPKDCIIAIGPSIGSCCYEVGEEVANKFNENYTFTKDILKEKGNNKYSLNLWEANKISFMECGVLEKNITISGLCTSCNNDLFFSYRKENGLNGRMAAFMKIL